MSQKLDLSSATNGSISKGSYLSQLAYSALKDNFTGGVLVKTPQGDAALFFRGGSPVHAAGTFFTTDHVGEILQRTGHVTQSQLAEALELQGLAGEARPLLGSLLVDGGVDPLHIKRAVQSQTIARFTQILNVAEGEWRSAPGENDRIREIGVMNEGWPLFIKVLTSGSLDNEMRWMTEELLGKAVKLKGGFAPIPGVKLDEESQLLVNFLAKPRKPDQLERALSRKLVRGYLRLLMLEDRLDTVPASQGIPIPKVTLLKGQGYSAVQAEPQARGDSAAKQAPPREPSVKIDPVLKREVEELHAHLDEKNYFELLGAKEETNVGELRKLFSVLAKKFHPDMFPAGTNEALAIKARDIAARMNEAYQTLSNEKSRAEYVVLLKDDRIKGDSRRAERVKEAETRFKMGTVMLKKKEYRQAREFFRFCMDADPETADYKAYYAWSLFADPTYDRAEALEQSHELLQEAVQKNERSPTAHYFAGEVLLAMGRTKEALHHFKITVKLDKKHTEATRQVRLIEMRESKDRPDSEKPSGLSRFFKR